MHSSKSLCWWRPRGVSSGCGTGISTRRSVTPFEPCTPERISSEVRPGRPSLLASAGAITRAISARLPELRDLRGAAFRLLEHAEELRRLLRDGIGDVAQHLEALLDGRVLRGAVPARG